MQRIECPIAQPGEWILPNGQAKFLGNWNYRGTVINPACQNIVFLGGGRGGLVKITHGQVHANYSFPKWQAAK